MSLSVPWIVGAGDRITVKDEHFLGRVRAVEGQDALVKWDGYDVIERVPVNRLERYFLERTTMSAIATRRRELLRLDIPRKRFSGKTGFPTFRKEQREEPQLWNLYKHGVSSSLLDTFLTCREQTRLHYVEGLSGHQTPISLEYGTCVHWVLEQMYRAWVKAHPRTAEEAKVQVHGWVDDYAKLWLATHDAPTADELQQQELCYGWAKVTLPQYALRWSGDWTGDYTHMENTTTHPASIVSLEEEFCVPYVYPDGVIIDLRGRRDVVFLGKDKRERVLDTKALSIIKDDILMDLYPHDTQQMMYLLVRLIETGKMPAGSVKNIIRRPMHRQKVAESLSDFLKRIEADVADPAQWDVKDTKGTTGWFVRFELAILESELLDWKENTFDPIMAELRDWYDGKLHHYANFKHAETKYGRSEMFFPIVKDDYSGVYRREKPFPELSLAV